MSRALVLAPLLWLAPLQALGGNAEFRLLSTSRAGEGFNDPTSATPVGGNPGTTVGEQRRIAFQYAAALWSATLGNQVRVTISATLTPLSCAGGLALLGATSPVGFAPGDPNPVAVENETAGQDRDPSSPEIQTSFNSTYGTGGCGSGWYHGLDNQPPGDTVDLSAVALHEFAHGLGFIASGTFAGQALYDRTGQSLAALDPAGLFTAVRDPLQISWAGPHVAAVVDEFLDQKDGVLQVNGTGHPLNLATFSPPGVSFTGVELVRAQDSGGSGATNACAPIAPATGKLVIADRDLSPDGGLSCFVVDRAHNAQQAGAVGLIVRHSDPGGIPISYVGDGTGITIPVWGISREDGATVESAIGSGAAVDLDAAGRRAGRDEAGRPLFYTPSVYVAASSVSHYDTTAKPHTLMDPFFGPTSRNLDLTPATLADVGWNVPQGVSVGAAKLAHSELLHGRPVVFVVQVVNRSASAASGVVLDQVLDPGLSLTSSSGACPGGFPCDLGTLEPWAVRTVIASYTLRNALATGLTQTFRITAASPAPSGANASTTVLASHLLLSGTGPSTGSSGTSGTYSFSLKNEGPDLLTTLIQHTITGPASATSLGGDCSGTDLCTLRAIAPGETRHWTLVVDHTAAGKVTLTSGTPGAGPEDLLVQAIDVSAAKSGCSVPGGSAAPSPLLLLSLLGLLAARRRRPT